MLSTLKDALDARIKKLKVHHQLKEIQVLALWKAAAGERLAGQTKATRLIRGQLYVKVTSSAWAHQLSFFRREYIQKINGALGEPLVKDIYFQVGDIDDEEEEGLKENQSAAVYPSLDLNDKEKTEICNVVSKIDSEDLQRAFRNFMEKDYKTRKAKVEEGWEKCKVCGSLCPPATDFCWFCEQGRSTGRKGRLSRWFRETPWINYDQALQLIHELKREEFKQVKEEIKITLRNNMEKYIVKLNAKMSVDHKAELQQMALVYAMLTTELTPDSLDHAILSEILGKELYNRAFGA
jgi:hypothetical protein